MAEPIIEQTPEQPPVKKRSPGRKKNTNFLSWEDAKAVVRDEMITSRSMYLKWHADNNPKTLPRFPHRVYKEWVSWNDFLGTDNKFQEVGKKWRPINEATLWAHTLGLKSQAEWLEYTKGDDLPEDIPTRPDVVYKNWTSWNHWLGNKPKQTVEARQAAQRVKIYYIVRHPDVPTNVFTFGIEDAGFSGIKERWERDKFDVIKLFWYDSTKSREVQQIISALSTPYYGDERQRLVPNIFDLIWYLQMHLDLAKPD